jgi:membrane fusion protein
MTDRVWRHRKPDWRGQRRIHGEISIFVPVSWQYISAGFLFFLLVGIVLASTASIPKVEVVPGTIQLSNGVIEITSSRSGVVSAIYVKDGERVDENGVVVAIRSEVDQLGRPGALHEAERAISVEDQSLSNQERLIRRAYDAQRLQIMQQISSIEEELVELDEQIALQEELRIAAEEDLERVKTVAVRGFISDREVNARHETTVSRRQHLSQLRQARTAKRSNVDELRQSLAVAGSKTDADIATIESARARVAQEAANVRGARAYALRAPIKGVADAIRTCPPSAPMAQIWGCELRRVGASS